MGRLCLSKAYDLRLRHARDGGWWVLRTAVHTQLKRINYPYSHMHHSIVMMSYFRLSDKIRYCERKHIPADRQTERL